MPCGCSAAPDDLRGSPRRRNLRLVGDGPYYAIRMSVHVFTSCGGIRVNHRMEVLDSAHDTIPGLYAVGNCAGGMYGSNYELTHPGESIGFAVNSGRIAAEYALEHLTLGG